MGNKIKTVIASVLKPVDDTRMYEKLGLSLHQTNRYEVNIIGFVSKNPPPRSDVRFFPVFRMKRGSFRRLLVSFRLLFYLFRLRPALLIATTFEILPAALVYKLFVPRVRLVYDIQENYALNMLSNRRQSRRAKWPAKVVRWLEIRSQAFIQLNLLAEKAYAKELPFVSNAVVLLNKFRKTGTKFQYKTPTEKSKPASAYPILVFTGTLSRDYGLLQSLDLVKSLAKIFPKLIAKFIGQVHDAKLLKYLLKEENQHLMLHVDSSPVPHSIILEEMADAHFGLVAHQPTPSIKNCFPTRIYELMALEIPIILQDHPPWTEFCQRWHACIAIDYNHVDTALLAEQMVKNTFYTRGHPTDIYWDSEEAKLIQAMDSLFGVKT